MHLKNISPFASKRGHSQKPLEENLTFYRIVPPPKRKCLSVLYTLPPTKITIPHLTSQHDMCNCCAGMMLPFVEGNRTNLARVFKFCCQLLVYFVFVEFWLGWNDWQMGASMAIDNFQMRVLCYSYWRDRVLSCDLGGSRKEAWLVAVDVETYISICSQQNISPFVSSFFCF